MNSEFVERMTAANAKRTLYAELRGMTPRQMQAEKIQLIKQYRQSTGCSLVEAKDVVEEAINAREVGDLSEIINGANRDLQAALASMVAPPTISEKIQLIKRYRDLTSFGLAKSKTEVESAIARCFPSNSEEVPRNFDAYKWIIDQVKGGAFDDHLKDIARACRDRYSLVANDDVDHDRNRTNLIRRDLIHAMARDGVPPGELYNTSFIAKLCQQLADVYGVRYVVVRKIYDAIMKEATK